VRLSLWAGVKPLSAACAEGLLAPATDGKLRLVAVGGLAVGLYVGAVRAAALSFGVVLGVLDAALDGVLVGAGHWLGVVEDVPLGAHRSSPLSSAATAFRV